MHRRRFVYPPTTPYAGCIALHIVPSGDNIAMHGRSMCVYMVSEVSWRMLNIEGRITTLIVNSELTNVDNRFRNNNDKSGFL